MDFTYGGLKVFFSKEIAEGLVLNTLQRLNMQQNAPEGKKHLYLTNGQVIAACYGSQSERNVPDGWKQNLAELREAACGILPIPWDGNPSYGGNDA
jgi:hypothetical protein